VKTLTLKENQVIYETSVETSLRAGEVIILERDGRPVAALMPIEEYEEYQAWRQQAHPTSVASNWLEDRTLEEVVDEIIRRGPGIPNVRKATTSLADYLKNAPHDPDFDLEEWNREWAKIESEIEANDPHPL
jgi:antitoxin (DNA-binding transcriptional repressor) of toxin-antitoxin stability system